MIHVRFLKLLDIMEKLGPDLGMPHTRAMGSGLFEIRVKAQEGLGRYFYGVLLGREIIILHCFVKKEQETLQRHLDIARARLFEVKNDS